jgi:predicted ATPase/DNA-binding CsgD family transcriptional regulator
MAPVRDPALVTAAIADALGVREMGGRTLFAGLQAFLADRHALLLLDNFEHLLDAAPLVAELLATCPKLTVLVASRAELRLSGEHVYMVTPLALPDTEKLPPFAELGEVPAVRLFVERARATRADFGLTTDNMGAVTQICRRLDGLPLAIELAAARCRVLTPAMLLSRLSPGLPLLTGGPRDVPDRLRSVASAIIWSHDLLSADERVLFRRLAVFVGGFTIETAESVCAVEQDGDSGSSATLDGIDSLLEKSLLTTLASAVGTSADVSLRFGMLETIREFGLEQLAESGEEESIRQRHAAFFLDLAARAEPDLHGEGDQLRWLAVFDTELSNVRAALFWTNERGDAAGAANLMLALWRFWQIRDHFTEAETWCTRILEHGEQLPLALRARVLAERGMFEFLQSSPERALLAMNDAVQMADESQDDEAIAWSNWVRAVANMANGDLLAATADAEVSMAIYTERGERWFAAASMWVIGFVRYFSGDVAGAEPIISQVVSLAREMGDYYGLAELSAGVALIELQRNNLDLAMQHFREALRCGQVLDHDYQIADAAEGIAVVLSLQGQNRRAAQAFGAIDALRVRSGSVRNPRRDAYVFPAIEALRDRFGTQAMDDAWQAGRAMSIEDALADADVTVAGTPALDMEGQPLTRRELEVLRLLVDGKSNAQIADDLFVSRRTAEAHVAAILQKFDVPTRAAAAAYGVRHGLV